MTFPAIGFSVWIWAAIDPILVGVAVYLGWRADQAGKVFIAAIAAFAVAVLADWLLTYIGIPWISPLNREGPIFLPVRAIAALLWAAAAFATRRILKHPA